MVNMLKCIFEFYGAVAQLGECDVRNVEVRGSIPLSSISPPNISKDYFWNNLSKKDASFFQPILK